MKCHSARSAKPVPISKNLPIFRHPRPSPNYFQLDMEPISPRCSCEIMKRLGVICIIQARSEASRNLAASLLVRAFPR